MIALFARAVPDRLMPYVVTIVAAGIATDRYGNEVRDWASATRTVTRAWIEQRLALGAAGKFGEDIVDRDRLSAYWLLIVPVGTPVSGYDRVEHDGQTYEVQGPPTVVHTLRGPHHTEAQLQWVRG